MLNINKDSRFSIIFINDKEMSELNYKYYKKVYTTTDVLSFPSSIENELGDIFISVEQAKKQAREGSLVEFSFLFIHGFLHLLGYNHEEKNEKEIMFTIQNNVMNEIFGVK